MRSRSQRNQNQKLKTKPWNKTKPKLGNGQVVKRKHELRDGIKKCMPSKIMIVITPSGFETA